MTIEERKLFGPDELKEIEFGEYEPRENGRTTVEAKCPFCGQWNTCYVWSLAGSGKRCECGAKLTRLFAFSRRPLNQRTGQGTG